MKRYAITEISDEVFDASPDHFRVWIDKADVLNGPLELMQWATKEVGVVVDYPNLGDHYLDFISNKWTLWSSFKSVNKRPVIPAPESEPDTMHVGSHAGWQSDKATFKPPDPPQPCPNCNEIMNSDDDVKYYRNWDGDVRHCSLCGKPESKWIYAKSEEKPCPNCQGNKPWDDIVAYKYDHYRPWVCGWCERPESEWTFTTDPGGIGGGGTGGPI